MTRCSICHTVVAEGEETHFCPECAVASHVNCWEGIGGCATYGCPAAAAAEKPPPPANIGAGWGDEKTCPACKRSLNASLLTCGCGALFPWADPMTPAEYSDHLAELEDRKKLKRIFVVLFALTLTALLAPITGLVAGLTARAKKEELKGQDGAFLALGYGTAALGGAHALVWLVLAMGG